MLLLWIHTEDAILVGKHQIYFSQIHIKTSVKPVEPDVKATKVEWNTK